MNNKIRVLLFSLIILGGYGTTSNCYCTENINQVQQSKYLNRYNKDLDKLVKSGSIDIDSNRNIIENDKFLQDTDLRSINTWLHQRHNYVMFMDCFPNCISKEIMDKISEDVKHLLDVFEPNSWHIANNLKLPQVPFLLSLSTLKEKYPEIITIISEKDNITIHEFETYLQNKLYKLNTEYIIQMKKYSMQDSINMNKLEQKMKQETINYYKKLKTIIDWLPIFLKTDLNLSEQETYVYTKKIESWVNNVNEIIVCDRDENDNINIKEDNSFLYYNKYLAFTYEQCENFNKLQNGKNIIENLNGYVSNNVYEFVYNMNNNFIYVLAEICYTIHDYLGNTTLLLFNDLKKNYPDCIPMNYNEDQITAEQFFAYLGNKLCLLRIKYSENIKNKVKKHNGNKLELENTLIQETKDMYNVLEPIANLLQRFLHCIQNQNTKLYNNLFKNKIKILRAYRSVFTCKHKDDNIIIEENNNLKNYLNYVSALIAPLEVDSKKELSKLIHDKKFLEFVYDSYQAFSYLNIKIMEIINSCFDSWSILYTYNIPFSNELQETINKLFPNNILVQEDFKYVTQILKYCSNKISQLGTLQLYNAIQQCINKYKHNNDENELKSRIKHQIIKIYHQNVTPIKKLLNDLLQEFVNKYNMDNLSEGQREKLLKLEGIIPSLGSILDEFAVKYDTNDLLGEFINLLGADNFDDILYSMPHDANGNIIENEDFLRKDFFDISDKLLNPIFYYNINDDKLYYIRDILFNFVYRINSIVDYTKMVSSNDSYLKLEKTSYPESFEYDNYNTWEEVDNNKFASGFNYQFDRKEANQKIMNIAKRSGYVDVLDKNGNFIYINPEQKITIGGGMSSKKIDTSKISMQELIILFKNKIVKEMVNVFRSILNSNLVQVDNLELKNIIYDEIIKGINKIEKIYEILKQFLQEKAQEKAIGNDNVIMNQIFGINEAIKSNNIDNLMKLRDILSLQKQERSTEEISKKLNINVEDFLFHAAIKPTEK